jgi:polyhydroxybutyrate depolymerase
MSAPVENRTHRTLTVGGVARDYLLSRSSASDPRPAIIVLHGGTMTADQIRQSVGVEPLVEREKIVAVYPQGIARQWNDGRRWQPTAWQRGASTADDVAFLRALVTALVQERIVDPQRVYVIGPSNGGMMTFRLLCEAADLLAAAAAIIASMPVDLIGTCEPARAVPILVMNGTADPLVPYQGGAIASGGRGEVLSTDDTIALLRRFNGCTGDPAVELIASRNAGPSAVTREIWTHCASGAPVVLYRIEGGGHRIPALEGEPRALVDRLLGPQNRDFDGAEAIWSFLRDKRR